MATDNLLVIDDDVTLNRLLVKQLRAIGYAANGVGLWQDARRYLELHEPNLIILDCQLPDAQGQSLVEGLARDYPVIVLTAYGSVKEAVRAMRDGAFDYLVKPVNLEELELVVKRTLEATALRQEYQFYKNRLQKRSKSLLVGSSKPMCQLDQLIDAVAPTDMTVLIQGESGVGKELIAQEIHRRSGRAERHFAAVDCCTLQETLFESELFGHERGAFTSADRQKKGLTESAAGGTLFLDEIGELSASIQAKLLRFLETGVFRRVGGTKNLNADVRAIAATNRDLDAMSRSGKFRADLFYRLNAFGIVVPPLRERREDIAALAELFLSKRSFARQIKKYLSAAAMEVLLRYDWPGNVRELKNILERAVVLSADKPEIRAEHLTIPAMQSKPGRGFTLNFEREPTLSEVEQRYLAQLLDKYAGHRAKVADVLGVSERNIYRMIKKYGLAH